MVSGNTNPDQTPRDAVKQPLPLTDNTRAFEMTYKAQLTCAKLLGIATTNNGVDKNMKPFLDELWENCCTAKAHRKASFIQTQVIFTEEHRAIDIEAA